MFKQFTKLKKFPNLKHLITTKQWGTSSWKYESFNLWLHVWDEKNLVLQNRKILAKNLWVEEVTYMNQIHGDRIELLKKSGWTQASPLLNCDALITVEKNLAIAVMVADCVPVILFDPVKEVLAVIHAWWKGTQLEIARKTLEKMQENFWCEAENIIAWIWPSISQENYEVWKEVSDNFVGKYSEFMDLASNWKYKLDLKNINKKQLLNIWVLETNIEIIIDCTFKEKELYFSARREGVESGRQVVVWIIK